MIFCVIFAQVLYKASEVDSQLELKEKHYDKVNKLKMIVSEPKILQNNLTLISSQIKRKTLYWVSVEIVLIAAHVVGVVFMFEDIQVNTNTNTNRSKRQIFSVT